MIKQFTLLLLKTICLLLVLFTGAQAQDKQTGENDVKKCDFSNYDRLEFIPQRFYLLLQITPVYPKEARREKIVGTVAARVLMNRQGRAAKICIVEGDKLLVPAVIATIKNWRYPRRTIQRELRAGNHKYVEFPISYTFK